MLEGMHWAEKTSTIMIDDDAYYAHPKTHPRDTDLINKPIENYAQMKMIYDMRVPAALLTLNAVHRALSHLMDHKTHANMYLAMTPAGRMDWFTAFLMKYYL
nr:uncharacterized protein LOC127313390 [Lolium perenne]